MKFGHFIIVKLSLFLICGICLGYYLEFPLIQSAYSCAFLLSLLFLVYLCNRKRFKDPISFGIIALILTLFIGVLSVPIHNEKLQPTHYTKVTVPIQTITFKVRDVLKPTSYYQKYVIDILQVNNVVVTGTALLNIKQDSLFTPLTIDDSFITTSDFKPIQPPLNPNQFDYKSYLARQYIYHQISTNNNELLPLVRPSQSIYGLAAQFRTFVNERLNTYPFDPDQRAIINALLLGQRQDISKSVFSDYSKAGAVHILAVSGLHVGILLLLLQVLLAPLERLPYGKGLKTVLLIGLLWCFAILTGLSPSVSRATLMFSLLAFSLNWNRPSHTFNTIAISAFLLLLYNPMLVFDVGFQLSYLAVISIVLLQPKLNALWHPKYKLTKLFWNILTVTCAAQVGVLPLSIYYFHQFPGLFFLSNLIIIPFLGGILGLGIGIIVLACFKLLPSFLAEFYNYTIGSMNAVIHWIAQQDTFIFSELSLQLHTVFALYLFLMCLSYLLFTFNYKSVVFTLLACIGLQLSVLYTKYNNVPSEWILFQNNKATLLSFKSEKHLHIYSTDTTRIDLKSYPLQSYVIANGIQSSSNAFLNPVYIIKNKLVLVVDSSAIYKVQRFKPNYVLLSQSPKINLNRLIDSLQPKEIIADASNYPTFIKRWETTCKQKKIPFYQTGKKGAYIFK